MHTPFLMTVCFPHKTHVTFKQQYEITLPSPSTEAEQMCAKRMTDQLDDLDMLRSELTYASDTYMAQLRILEMALVNSSRLGDTANVVAEFSKVSKVTLRCADNYLMLLGRMIQNISTMSHRVQVATPGVFTCANGVYTWTLCPQLAITDSSVESQLALSGISERKFISLAYPATLRVEMHMLQICMAQLHFNMGTAMAPTLFDCAIRYDTPVKADAQTCATQACSSYGEALRVLTVLAQRDKAYWRGLRYLAGRQYTCCGELDFGIIEGWAYLTKSLLYLGGYQRMSLLRNRKMQQDSMCAPEDALISKDNDDNKKQNQSDEGSSSSSSNQIERDSDLSKEDFDLECVITDQCIEITQSQDRESPSSSIGALYAAGEFIRMGIASMTRVTSAVQQNGLLSAMYVMKAAVWGTLMLRLSMAFMRYTMLSEKDLLELSVKDANSSATDSAKVLPWLVKEAMSSEFVKSTWNMCGQGHKVNTDRLHPDMWRYTVYTLCLRASHLSMFYSAQALMWSDRLQSPLWSKTLRRSLRDYVYAISLTLLQQRIDDLARANAMWQSDGLQARWLWTILQAPCYHYMIMNLAKGWMYPSNGILFPHDAIFSNGNAVVATSINSE